MAGHIRGRTGQWIAVVIASASCSFLPGCFAVSKFETGRTLATWDQTFCLGFEDLLWRELPSGTTEADGLPHVKYALGLPGRLETGVDACPYILEAQGRCQINPREFTPVDVSIDAKLGAFFPAYFRVFKYAKIGGTASRTMRNVAPYLYYSHFLPWPRQTKSTVDSLAASLYLSASIVGMGAVLKVDRWVSVAPEVECCLLGAVPRRIGVSAGFIFTRKHRATKSIVVR